MGEKMSPSSHEGEVDGFYDRVLELAGESHGD